MKNKKVKLDKLLSHIGKSDITSLVNFKLLNKFLTKNKLFSKIVNQSFFLKSKIGVQNFY